MAISTAAVREIATREQMLLRILEELDEAAFPDFPDRVCGIGIAKSALRLRNSAAGASH